MSYLALFALFALFVYSNRNRSPRFARPYGFAEPARTHSRYSVTARDAETAGINRAHEMAIVRRMAIRGGN